MQPKQIIIDGQFVTYYPSNNFDSIRTTIIFLHGWRSESKVWFPIIFELQKTLTGYNYLAVDLPGFGSSPISVSDWKMRDYANLVDDLIIKLNLSKVILVGHSFGGRTSIKLAGEVYDNEKYKIEKIILTGSAGFVDNSNPTSLKQKVAKIVKPLFNLPIISALKPMVYKFIGADDYNAREDLKQIFVNVINEDLSEQMKKIKRQTLIISGRNDESTPVSFGERMDRLIPDSTLKIIENAGHFAFLDKPNEWVEVVKSFIIS